LTNHNGSIEIAKQLIDMAKDCGADYVKFQKRTVATVYDEEMLNQPRESPWGKTQLEQKLGLEFGMAEYREIDAYCKKVGIPWFASCWDEGALDFIEEFDVPMHKIASPMLTNIPFLKRVAALGKFTLISTGMSTLNDIAKAVNIFQRWGTPFVLMHCCSVYPCPEDMCNILTMEVLRKRFPDITLGYSGHEVGLIPSILGVAWGAEWVERHITLDRAMYGSDQSASLEHRGLELLVKYLHSIEDALGVAEKIIYPMEIENAKKLRWFENA